MARSFEDLEVWQQSMRLAHRVRLILHSREYCGDADMRSQIRRAAVSIPSNIAEGYEKGSAKDSVKFYRIAKGSAGELRTQLLLCQMNKDLPELRCRELLEGAIFVSRSLGGFIRHLQNRESPSGETSPPTLHRSQPPFPSES